jgi:phosphohistidine phosphatase
MKIYLMRHGIAREPDGPSVKADSQRTLTPKGRDKIGKIAHALKMLGIQPDLILSSPYTRAKETAILLAREFDCKKNLRFSDLLVPDGNTEEIINAIVENYEMEELVIVGHEPCLSLLVSTLAVFNLDLFIHIKKGGVCCLSADAIRIERRATLEWLFTPKILLKV